jgi:hypothetical protein
MNKAAEVLLFAVSLAALPARPAVLRPALAKAVPSFPWPAPGQRHSPAAALSKPQLAAFWNSIAEELWGLPSEIGQYAFVQCWAGRVTLVATFSVNEWFNSVAVVDWDGVQTRVHQLPARYRYDLEQRIADVDGDGLIEIVAQELALHEGAATTKPVVWCRVFKARGDYTLEDVSRQNRAYFEKVIIPELDQLDAGLGERYEGADLVSAKAQVQFVRDKYRRMLYGEREAGFNNAVAWSHSAQRELQQLAIEALYDIGTKEAREELTRLSGVSDELVAGRARRALYVMDAGKR